MTELLNVGPQRISKPEKRFASANSTHLLSRAVSSTPSSMKRVGLASFVGSAIEFYDFYIYGTAAALVFPTVFFPRMSPSMAAVASLATFAAAFLSRPLGAAFFGHFGDRLGRKTTLVATLLIMGLSTMAVGMVPGAATIGIAAPPLLLTLRLVQGFAVGGEWAGSALLAAEYAPPATRGRYGMFTQLGVGSGLVMSSLLFLFVNSTIGETGQTFMNWGWRLPFLFSAVLVVIGLYVRVNVAETPVFAEQKARNTVSAAPAAELFRAQRRQVLLAAGSLIGVFTLGFMASTFLTNYAHTHLGYSTTLILFVGVMGGLVAVGFTALSAVLCDTFGRRRIIMVAFAAGVPWSFTVLPLLNTRDPVLFAVAIAGTFAVAGMSYGPMASFIPELFATRYRYSGAGLALNLAGLIGGAVPPLIAAPLMAASGSTAIGAMMGLYVLISLVCTYLLPETIGGTMRQDSKGSAGAESSADIVTQFTAQVDHFVTSPHVNEPEAVRRFLAAVAPRGDESALDVACGPGLLAQAFAPHVREYVGVDLTPAMVDKAGAIAREVGITNARFEIGDALALPFEANTFDFVLTRLALHHLAEPRRAIHEMARVLRPGGRLGVFDMTTSEIMEEAAYHNVVERLRDPSHASALPLSELVQIIRLAGLEIDRVDTIDYEQDVEDWIARAEQSADAATRARELIVAATGTPMFGGKRVWRDDDGSAWFSVRWAILVATKSA